MPSKSENSEKQLKVTLVKSLNGRLKKHKATIESLGLRRIRHSIIVNDLPSVRGKLNQVAYLLNVEDV